MKKFLILSAVLLSSFAFKAADAQVRFNLSIGNQPEWGPYGYERADYYYLPEIGVYYNVSNRTYTYLKGNHWVTKSKLPHNYRNYDLYHGYKVVINDREPWSRNTFYQSRYAQFRDRHDQRSIRDYRNSPAYARDNDRYDRWDDRRPGSSRPERKG